MTALAAETADVDPFHIRKYYEPLRVADVCDGLGPVGIHGEARL